MLDNCGGQSKSKVRTPEEILENNKHSQTGEHRGMDKVRTPKDCKQEKRDTHELDGAEGGTGQDNENELARDTHRLLSAV
jgi:hypothetical protein